MPGNGNGGGGSSSFSSGWMSTGEGGRQPASVGGQPITLPQPEPDPGPAPHVPVIREARNVQRANIDRSSFYDPTSATQALGADYLQQRNASNPQPLGSTGAGAVGYDFTPSDERLY